MQGLLELAGVPYVGSGVTASALCMDKDLFKAVLRDRGIPVARNVTLRAGDPVENPFGYPVFVKPARLGSSVGISKVAGAGGARGGRRARPPPRRQGARRGVPARARGRVRRARESRAGRLGRRRDRRARRLVRLRGEVRRGRHGARDPGPDLDEETTEEVRRLAVESFVATDCEGMARVDFFVRPDGEVVVNELNTIPGFTATSVYAKLFAASGDPVRGAARPARRARARAARAAPGARRYWADRARRARTASSALSQASSASSSSASVIVSGQSTRMQFP